MKSILVVGTGYVGLSNAVLLAQHNNVTAVDIAQNKVDLINNKQSPIDDKEIQEYLTNASLNLVATTDVAVYKDAEIVIIATPTNYDEVSHRFDTSSVETVIETLLKYNPNALMVIKSTIPVGYIDRVKKKYGIDNILFSPEFLREGKALYDNLYPSRIIVGEKSARAEEFANLLLQGAIKKEIDVAYNKQQQENVDEVPSNPDLFKKMIGMMSMKNDENKMKKKSKRDVRQRFGSSQTNF